MIRDFLPLACDKFQERLCASARFDDFIICHALFLASKDMQAKYCANALPIWKSLYTDEAYEERRHAYTHAQPFTKESLLYREIFEKYYPGQSEMVTDFWMPNREWEGCNVNDPSARVLSNYGASGE